MGLPVVPLPSDSVEVAGEKVQVRGLSYDAVVRFQAFDSPADSQAFLLAFGLDMPEDEVREWSNSTPADVVEPVIRRIAELSGLIEGAQKSS